MTRTASKREDEHVDDTTTDDPTVSTVPIDEAGPGRAHAVVVPILIVLAAIILLVTAVNVWVDRAALNTDNWVDASDELLAEPVVREAIAVYVVDQLYTNVDVAAELTDALPGDFSRLSSVLATALRNPATDAVDRLLSTDQLAEVWSNANRVAHETIVRILEDDARVEALSTADGVVTLEVRQVVVQLADTIGLPSSLIDRIPEDAGQITIIESSKLEDLQSAVAFVQWASWLLFILVVVLYAVAIFLADGWRRVATRGVGLSILIVGLLVLAGLRFGGDILLDSVVEKESNRGVAEAVWQIGSELLKDLGRHIAAIGALIVVGAFLAGPTRIATTIRRFIAPAFVGSSGTRWAIGAAVFLVMVLWAPLPALSTWIGILVFAGILAACIEGLRRLCLADIAQRKATVVVAADDEVVATSS